jgi:carboxyl-terminal processing protease
MNICRWDNFWAHSVEMKIYLFLLSVLFLSLNAKTTFADALSIFDQTTETVTKNFYDQSFRGLPWPDLVKDARKKLSANSYDQELEKVINDLLLKLHASHTEFVSSADQEYWALESVFSFTVDGKPIYQIGAWFKQDLKSKKWFVRDVFEGSQADLARFKVGDEILSVNGHPFEPVNSFNHSARTISVQIKRSKKSAPHTLLVASLHESFQRTMLKASIASYRVEEICGKKIAYFHLWAGTNDESMEALADVAKKAAGTSDAFILDLRDGFGGAYPAYLNPFFDHDDERKKISIVYDKPMIGLINDGVRSGKEWVADVLKKTKRATLVGTQTKGYFLAAKVFPIVEGKFDLYLAIAKGPGPDLEGNGVKPDVEVSFTSQYSAGVDPQLTRALQILGGQDLEGSCKNKR